MSWLDTGSGPGFSPFEELDPSLWAVLAREQQGSDGARLELPQAEWPEELPLRDPTINRFDGDAAA